MGGSFRSRLAALLQNDAHLAKAALIHVLTAKTSISSSGYPYISENSFRLFLQQFPHLFKAGERLLVWLARIEVRLQRAKHFSVAEVESVQRAVKVLHNIVQSAAICAPPDLWVLKHVLSVHRQIGLTEIFLSGQRIDAVDLASRFGLDAQHLSFDLSFLHSRGLLRLHAGHYRIETTSQAKKAFQSVQSIPAEMLRDMVEPMVNILSGKSGEGESRKLVADFLRLPKPTKGRVHGWI